MESISRIDSLDPLPLRYGVMIQKTCLECSAAFNVTIDREHTAKYCSRKCMGLGRRRVLPEKHPHWKGGRSKMLNGYIRVRVNKTYRYEHRVVMERVLGRPLRSGEVVHHKDGDRTNNAPKNLEVMRRHHHDSHETLRRWRDDRVAMLEGIRKGGETRRLRHGY